MRREYVLRFAGECDEGEILHEIEGELHQQRIDRVPESIDLDRVAVRRSTRQDFGCECTVRAGAIFHYDRLPQAFGELGLQTAGDEVRATPGRCPDQDADGFGWIGRLTLSATCRAQGDRTCEQQHAS